MGVTEFDFTVVGAVGCQGKGIWAEYFIEFGVAGILVTQIWPTTDTQTWNKTADFLWLPANQLSVKQKQEYVLYHEFDHYMTAFDAYGKAKDGLKMIERERWRDRATAERVLKAATNEALRVWRAGVVYSTTFDDARYHDGDRYRFRPFPDHFRVSNVLLED
jgi:hypothetical protein